MATLSRRAVAAAPFALGACDKDDLGVVYYVVAAAVGSALVAWITRRYRRGYQAAMENVARKYNGTVTRFGGGAGSDVALQGAHGGHRFTFEATAEGNGSRLTLRVHGRPLPPPVRLYLADRQWWHQAAATFGVDPGYGQPYQDYVFIADPPDVAAALLGKPGVQAHLEALRWSIPLSLLIGPRSVDYSLTFQGQQLHSQPKYYKEEILSWWIEALVAFTAALEQE
jgi:hypothetical protein